MVHGRVRAGEGAGRTTGNHPEAGFLLRSASHRNPTRIKWAVHLVCLYFCARLQEPSSRLTSEVPTDTRPGLLVRYPWTPRFSLMLADFPTVHLRMLSAPHTWSTKLLPLKLPWSLPCPCSQALSSVLQNSKSAEQARERFLWTPNLHRNR